MIVYFCRPLLYNSNLKQDNKRQSHLLKVMERKWFSALHWKHRDDFICLSAPFFSRVWWQPQGWTRRSNPVSWLSSSIRAQPALHVDHRGAPWEHYQVRGTFFVSFLLALSFGITFFVFFGLLACLFRRLPFNTPPFNILPNYLLFAVVFITFTGCCVINPKSAAVTR